jgi:hypothetical protein
MSDLPKTPQQQYDITYYEKMKDDADTRAKEKNLQSNKVTNTDVQAKLLTAAERERKLSNKADIVIKAWRALDSVYVQEGTPDETKYVMKTRIQANVALKEATLPQSILLDKEKRVNSAAAMATAAATAAKAAKAAAEDVPDWSTQAAEAAAKARAAEQDAAYLAREKGEAEKAAAAAEPAAEAAATEAEAARMAAVSKARAAKRMASEHVLMAVKGVEDAAFDAVRAAAEAENASAIADDAYYGSSTMGAGGAKRAARRGKQVSFNPYAGKTNTKKYRRRNKRKTKHYKKKAKRYTKKRNMRY